MDYKIQNFHNYFSKWRFKTICITNNFLFKQNVNLNNSFATHRHFKT